MDPKNITTIKYKITKLINVQHLNLVLPLSLTSLTFICFYNQPTDNLPLGLTNLIFRSRYNQPTNNLPLGLTSLTFGSDYNQPINNLPLGLKNSTFGYFIFSFL